jgi:hypothetical protein
MASCHWAVAPPTIKRIKKEKRVGHNKALLVAEPRKMLPIDTQAAIRKLACDTPEMKEMMAEFMDMKKLTHEIVKNKNKDRELHLVAITRRMLYCCPLPEGVEEPL